MEMEIAQDLIREFVDYLKAGMVEQWYPQD
jgi:hypothetical protein